MKVQTFEYVKNEEVLGYGAVVIRQGKKHIVVSDSEDGFFTTRKEAKKIADKLTE